MYNISFVGWRGLYKVWGLSPPQPPFLFPPMRAREKITGEEDDIEGSKEE